VEAEPYAGRYRDGTVQANGLDHHYTEWNPDGGNPMLLVHGANVQLHTWDPIAADLSRDRRVVCLDLRGHGDTQWARDGYWVRNFVADIDAVTKALEMQPFDLIGHSLGARVGIGYAGAFPAAVGHLVLSDTGPETPREGAKFAQSIVGSTGDVRGFRSHDEALAHYQKLHPEWKPVFHQLHALFQVRENWAGKLVFKSDPDLFWMTGSAGLKEVPWLWEMTARITAPTLILWGRQSHFFDDDLAQRMLALIPKAELARTETGHYIPREDPDDFLRLVRDFVSR
jgi:pimeloyl-ACP methyl ester carboxylesterase